MNKFEQRHSDIAQRQAAARLVAKLVMRDRVIDWREIEFLDRSGAYEMLGVPREQFMAALAQYASRKTDPDAQPEAGVDADLEGVTERNLQLVVAALLVYLCEIDRKVQPSEQQFVERAFSRWRITPEVLQSELRVPAARTARALHGAA